MNDNFQGCYDETEMVCFILLATLSLTFFERTIKQITLENIRGT